MKTAGEDATPGIPRDWYAHTFDALYPLIYEHRTVEAAESEARFAAEVLKLSPGARVLDLACGAGRHMVHLARMGCRVAGLDYSGQLLQAARETLGGRGALVRADMRAIPFIETFDAVVNFFTSFGYFAERRENEQTVRECARALLPHGGFFIDYVNKRHVIEHIEPESKRRVAAAPDSVLGKPQSGSDELEIDEQRWIDAESQRVNKAVTISQEGRRIHEVFESVQLYEPGEFTAMLERGGLEVEQLYGDYTGAPLNDALPRMIAVGRRARPSPG
jgi:SAM-dependent methyltransferase